MSRPLGEGDGDGVAVSLGPMLTPMQRSLLASHLRQPDSPHQTMALLAHLDGPIDPDRLAAAFATVAARHDVLRTAVDGESIRVDTEAPASTTLSLDRDETLAWAERRATHPMDLSDGVVDSVIVTHPDDTVSWYLALHHIATDATSSAAVFAAVSAAYHGDDSHGDGSAAEETRAERSYYRWYRRYERAEHTPRQLAQRRAARDHWDARTPAPRLGRLYQSTSTNPAMSAQSDRLRIELGPERLDLIDRRLEGDYAMLSPELGWTTLLLGATALYLHRLTGQDRFAIGLPVHNRSDAEARQVIGPVMEVYPVDVACQADDTAATFHRRIGRSVLATLRRTGIGLAPPAADVESVVNVIPGTGFESFGPIPVVTHWLHTGATDPSHLLRVQLTGYGDTGRELLLDLNRAAAAPRHRARAVDHFLAALDALLDEPDRRLAEVSLVTDTERAELDRWGRGPDEPAPIWQSPIQRIREALLARSEAITLDDGVTSLTGRQIVDWVDHMAARLADEGIGPRTRVAIRLPRSIEAVVAIWAVMSRGASFVPLDPSQPTPRLDELTRRAGAALTLDSVVARPVGDASAQSLADALVPTQSVGPDDEAYLLFTSGSTGEPKGVPITQRGLDGYLRFAVDAYFDGPPVAGLFSALTFDLTITTLFAPVLAGGRVVVIEPDGPAGLREVAERTDIDWLKATPSHLDLLLRWLGDDHGLRTLVVGGEAFTMALARRLWRWRSELVLLNEYGPTEAVVGCMIHRADPDEARADVPIGRPAPGVTLAVFDPGGQPAPIGAVGELAISHDGLTAGYLGGDGDDSFVLAPAPGGDSQLRRWYRSGDLVELVGDEELRAIYLGRADAQVKIGGIRLDPSEVEAALVSHPAVGAAAVRTWSPARSVEPRRHCSRCGLPDNVPGTSYDTDGVCNVCHDYDRVRQHTADYFGDLDDLARIRDDARAARLGRYDAIHLLSGGKDSTYALHRLVELGFEVLALTLDNGFISDGAIANARRSAHALGVDHELMTTPVMNEIFADSLDRFSNVCHGCYKTIYTLATQRAEADGIPVIVTGLSRGQLFETRLIPAQFGDDRFDPQAIDDAVLAARRVYHRLDDVPNRLLDTAVFAPAEAGHPDVFDRVRYVDFYRYLDVELAEMLAFLEQSAPWIRPSDTGRSTNCLINAAGIHTHQIEQGYHNYAEPYAWDVRLGHKTRDEAIDELDDRDDEAVVAAMLAEVGYVPKPRRLLTAWLVPEAGQVVPDPAELRRHVAARLPSHAVPTAFVAVDELPITQNGKLDVDSLPAPTRRHRQGPGLTVAPTSQTERTIVGIWERLLGLEPIGVTDDFFELGGDSLLALTMIVEVGRALGADVPEELAFGETTAGDLAAALDVRLDEGGAAAVVPIGSADEGPVRRDRREPPPRSAAEEAVLFAHLENPDDPRYNVARISWVPLAIDGEAVAHAVRALIDRHETLHWTHGFPREPIDPSRRLEASVRRDQATAAEVRATARAIQQTPFDLDRGPLVRLVVQPVESGTAITIVTHHVAIDARSLELLWRELTERLESPDTSRWPDPAIDYGDHVVWQRTRPDRGADAAYWRGVDAEGFEQPEWPRVGEGPGYVSRPTSLTRRDLAALGATPFAVALTGLSRVVRRRLPAASREAVLGLGVVGSTRDHPAVDAVIGQFINPLPVALRPVPAPSAGSEIDDVQHQVRQALLHRRTPFAEMVADRRRNGLDPLRLDTLVSMQEIEPSVLWGHRIEHEILGTGSSVADVSFFVQLDGDAVTLAVEFADSVLGGEAARAVLAEFEHEIRLLLPPTDIATMLDRWGERRPDHPAVIVGEAVLTHGQLAGRARAVAELLRDHRSEPVGIEASRHLDFMVAALGALQAGVAYVPIDPKLPPARIEAIVAAAGITQMLTLTDQGSWPAGVRTTALAAATTASSIPPPADREEQVSGDTPAYVLFTSGSTGVPKGVVVSRDNLRSSTLARHGYYPDDLDAFLVVSPLVFDSSIAGLFWALSVGGTVVLPEPGLETEVGHLAELIERHAVSHVLAVPSLHRLLLGENEPDTLAGLRHVIVAGEPCPPSLVELHHDRLPRTVLHNEYGPTEATVWSHVHTFEPGESTDGGVPIGRPIPGAFDRVLDPETGLEIDSSDGELWIGGPGVATGYLSDDRLTAQRFVDLDGDGGRWYRTGDLVRRRGDGALVFLGRADDQLEIRGHRIEAGDVERAMETHPAVAVAVAGAVVLSPDRPAALVVWYQAQASVSVAALRDHLAGRLPASMMPTQMIEVQIMPTTPTGKLDRAALASSPTMDRPAATPDQPAAHPASAPDPDGEPDEVLAQLIELFGDALETEVGPDDDFFHLGGDSIVSIQIVSRARKAGLDLTPGDVFDHTTPRALAHLVAGSARQPDPGPKPAVTDGAIPLLPIQRWLLQPGMPEPNHWHQYRWLDIAPGVDLDRLRNALATLTQRHPGLNHRFTRSGDEWAVSIGDPARSLAVLDHDPSAIGDTVARAAATVDIGNGPLLVGEFRRSDAGIRLLLLAHHLVVDGVSWTVLLDDLDEAYRRSGAKGAVLAPGADVASWARGLEQASRSYELGVERALWLAALPDDPRPSRPSATHDQVDVVAAVLPLDALGPLTSFETQVAVLRALGVAGAELLGWRELSVMLEGHGRRPEALEALGGPRVDLDRLVGWTTTHHPVRAIWHADPTEPLSLRIGRAVRRALDVPNHGLGYGLIAELRRDPVLRDAGQPTTLVNYLGRIDQGRTGEVFTGGGPLRTSVGGTNPVAHDLGLQAAIEGSRLRLELHVAGDWAGEANPQAGHAPPDPQAFLEAITTDLLRHAPGVRPLVELSAAERSRVLDALGVT